MTRSIMLAIFIAFMGILLGAVIMYTYNTTAFVEIPQHVETKSDVVLEKIQKVYKMVVVEGEFADIVDYKDYYGWDVYGLRKRALVKIKGRVSVGYNMDSLKIEYDETNKIVILQNWPEPEILSIDSDISYYDLENGMFNAFSPEELNKIYAAAKDSIRQQALRSKLIPMAREQAGDMFEMITFMAESTGWRVAYSDDNKLLIDGIAVDRSELSRLDSILAAQQDTQVLIPKPPSNIGTPSPTPSNKQNGNGLPNNPLKNNPTTNQNNLISAPNNSSTQTQIDSTATKKLNTNN